MSTLSNYEFALTKLKGYLCLSEKGELFRVQDWKVEDGSSKEVVKTKIFRKNEKVKVTTPAYISRIACIWSKHVGTDYHTYREFDVDEQGYTMERYIDYLELCRKRFLKMREDLEVFGISMVKTEEPNMHEKVADAISKGADASLVGRIIGNETGII